jgi:type II secretory pathway component PulC
VIPRATLDKVLGAGPGWMLSKVPLEPVRGTDRKFVGFRIVSVFDGSPTAERFGVRPGDMLLQVQRQRIVTPGDLLTAYQRAKGASEIAVEVQRDGKPVSLRWPVLDAGQALPGAPTGVTTEPQEPEREPIAP